jgi:hypothetical protein
MDIETAEAVETLRADIYRVERTLSGTIAGVETSLSARIEDVESSLTAKMHELHEEAKRHSDVQIEACARTFGSSQQDSPRSALRSGPFVNRRAFRSEMGSRERLEAWLRDARECPPVSIALLPSVRRRPAMMNSADPVNRCAASFEGSGGFYLS